MTGYSSFIDIGLKKSSLSIFKNNKLLYLNNTHIGGDHITRDISKILKVVDKQLKKSIDIAFVRIKKFHSQQKFSTPVNQL